MVVLAMQSEYLDKPDSITKTRAVIDNENPGTIYPGQWASHQHIADWRS